MALLRDLSQSREPSIRTLALQALANCRFTAEVDDEPHIKGAIEKEAEEACWLLQAIQDVSEMESTSLLRKGLLREVQKGRDRILTLLSFLHDRDAMLQVQMSLLSVSEEVRANALEIIDNIIQTDIKRLLLPLLDDISTRDRWARMRAIFPQEQLGGEARLREILEGTRTSPMSWVRICASHAVGENRSVSLIDSLTSSLGDSDEILRETAAWAIHRTDRATFQQVARRLQADPSPVVRQTVHRLAMASEVD
jgi:hypothetical protein